MICFLANDKSQIHYRQQIISLLLLQKNLKFSKFKEN